MGIAKAVAKRSEDPYVKVGACILRRDFSVASCGYNGAPPKINIDWSNRDERRKRVIHAEMNALRYVRPGEGYMIAVTLQPCSDCIKNIVAHGIKKIFFLESYKNDEFAVKISKEFGASIVQLKN